MKLDEIRKIVSQHNIKAGKMKKSELVQAIQQVEGNEACFDSGKAAQCGQEGCLWREECA